MLPSKNCIVLVLTLKTDLFGVNFYEWCEEGVQLHSFVNRYAPFIEKPILSLLNCFGLLVRDLYV